MTRARDDARRRSRMRALLLSGALVKHRCGHCGALLAAQDGHYMPPSMGEPGRWVCDPPRPA